MESATATGNDFDVHTTCGSLAFSPRLGVSAAKDSGDNGVGVMATIAQAVGEAAISGSTLSIPSAMFSPNVAALLVLLNSGTPVGSATANSPLLPQAISGPVYLTGSAVAPALTVQLPGCGQAPNCPAAKINLVGTLSGLGTAATKLTFSQLPDLPLSSLAVQLNSGKNALFTTSCAQPNGAITGMFTGQNGASSNTSTSLSVAGCVAAAPSVSNGSLTGLKKGKPKLSFKLHAGMNAPKLKSFTVKLPGGLSFNSKKLKKGIKVSGGKAKVKGGKLVVTLKSAVGSVSVTVKSPALKVSNSLRKKVKKHKVKSLKIKISVTDSSGTTTNAPLTIKHVS